MSGWEWCSVLTGPDVVYMYSDLVPLQGYIV